MYAVPALSFCRALGRRFVRALGVPWAYRLCRPLVWALGCGASVAVASTEATVPGDDRPRVVLLHGLARTPRAMAGLAARLESAGFAVRNLSYPSRRADLATLARETLGPEFAAAAGRPEDARRVHVVTHSMGGILLRQYLHDHGVPSSLGRVVMLAPPNQGSELVDRLGAWPLYQALNGPAGVDLGTDPASAPLRLGQWPAPTTAPLLVIAGDFSWNPLLSAWLPGDDDGKVSVARTHLAGESAHVTMPYSHTWLMWRSAVAARCVEHLRATEQSGTAL
jgi:triacylglycerol lipase